MCPSPKSTRITGLGATPESPSPVDQRSPESVSAGFDSVQIAEMRFRGFPATVPSQLVLVCKGPRKEQSDDTPASHLLRGQPVQRG
jgi:hypothetical protein